MMRKPSSRCPLYPGMRSGCARRRLKSACSTYAETSRAVATMRPKVGIVIGPRCKKGIINWTSEYTRRRPEARKPPLNQILRCDESHGYVRKSADGLGLGQIFRLGTRHVADDLAGGWLGSSLGLSSRSMAGRVRRS